MYSDRHRAKRLSLLGLLIVGGACLASATWAKVISSPESRPNIVMFISDDHGVEFAGCYGNKTIRTSNIDALASEGMRFTRMFAASATCAPSRAVIYTGLYPARNGAMANHSTCRPDIKALPTYLKALGYRVVLANKVHVKPKEVFDFEYLQATLPRNPKQPRRYRQEGLDTQVVDRFLADHAQSKRNQPLCLILADNGPHVTWEKNRSYDPAQLLVPRYMVDTPTTRKALANYYQDITTMDERVGEVLASLKKRGYQDNTLFIYTSDQGSEWPHSKWTVYDTGIRTPFIARWPGKIKPGTLCEALVSFVDITPTFIEIAAAKPPVNLDGRSFRDVLLGQTETFRQRIFASHSGDGQMNVFPQRCVRDQRYKYVLNLRPENTWTTHFTKVPGIPDSHKAVWDTWIKRAKNHPEAAKLVDIIQHHPAEELYDLQTDPNELHNIADKPEMQQILERMRNELKQWMASQGDPGLQKE
ncbi:sulfatase [Acidobacteria bacterium AH-259-O06]|nr:sulfatase [Acidobacteria bacterium AH-259-O06]